MHSIVCRSKAEIASLSWIWRQERRQMPTRETVTVYNTAKDSADLLTIVQLLYTMCDRIDSRWLLVGNLLSVCLRKLL